MSSNVKGFDDLQEQLKQMEKGAKELEGTHEVAFDDLFPKSFMKEHSSFSSFDDLLCACGYNIEANADFATIPDDEFDQHICSMTDFECWADMLDSGTEQYALKKLGF